MDIEKLLLKVLNDEAGAQEYAALEAWKKESEENIKLLKELQAQQSGMQSEYKSYDKNAAWHKVDSRILKSEQPKRRKSIRLVPIGIAAALLLSLFFFINTDKSPEQPTEYLATEEKLNFRLEDQSDIWLREGGELSVISDFEGERRVALSGEAFFDVAHDKEAPFIIELKGEDFVKVVGTSFNLLNKGEEFNLSLFSGIVELHMNNRIHTLRKGDRATRVNGSIVISKENDINSASWQSEVLVFENIGFTQVINTLEKHFDTTIDFSSESNNVAGCSIRTQFTNESLDTVMKELATIFSFNYEIMEDNKVIINDLACS